MRGAKPDSTARARGLRRGQTDAERRLWYRLNNRQLGGRKFVRQEPIGPYIADFCCRSARLVVELDGSQHAESERDEVRDRYLSSVGYRVLRFWNAEVFSNLDGVLETVLLALVPVTAPSPSPFGLAPDPGEGVRSPLPAGGER